MASLEGVRTAPPDRGWPDHLRRRGLDGLDRPRARPIELVEITGRAAIRTGSSGPKTRRTARNQGSCAFEWPLDGERSPPPEPWSRRARPPGAGLDHPRARLIELVEITGRAAIRTGSSGPRTRRTPRNQGSCTFEWPVNGPRHRVIELVEITFLRRGLDGLDHPRARLIELCR